MKIKDLKVGDWFSYKAILYVVFEEADTEILALTLAEYPFCWQRSFSKKEETEIAYISYLHLENNFKTKFHMTFGELPEGAIFSFTSKKGEPYSKGAYVKYTATSSFCIRNWDDDAENYKWFEFEPTQAVTVSSIYELGVQEVEKISIEFSKTS